MNARHWLVATLPLLLLVGCYPQPVAVPAPLLPAEAQRVIDYATATAQVAVTQKAVWTVEAQIRGTEHAAVLTQSAQRITETSAAQRVEQTAIRVAQQAAQTATALPATAQAISLAMQAEQDQATAQARIREAEVVKKESDAAGAASAWKAFTDALSTVLSVIVIAIIVVVLAACGIGVLWVYSMANERVAREQAVTTTNYIFVHPITGRMYYWLEDGKPMLLEDGTPNLPSANPETADQPPGKPLGVVPILSGGNVVGTINKNGHKAEDNRARAKALNLLRAAIEYQKANPDWPKDRIPGHREIKWHGSTWDGAVKALARHIEREGGRGNGTFVAERYATVLQLFHAINGGELL